MKVIIGNIPDSAKFDWVVEQMKRMLGDGVTIEQCNGYDAETAQHQPTKKIQVNCCRNCPLRELKYEGMEDECFACIHAATDGFEIEDIDTIPEWCALMDDQ